MTLTRWLLPLPVALLALSCQAQATTAPASGVAHSFRQEGASQPVPEALAVPQRALAAEASAPGGLALPFDIGQFSRQIDFTRVDDGYFVVWSSGDAICCQRLDAAGRPISKRVTLQSGDMSQYFPRVAYDPGLRRLLVVWYGAPAPNLHETQVYGRMVDEFGVPLGERFQISESLSDSLEPAVTFNPETQQYLVVWNHFSLWSPWTGGGIFAQLVDADGRCVGACAQVYRGASSKPSVAYVPSTGEFWTVWSTAHSFTEPLEGDILAQRLTASGSPSGALIRLHEDWHIQTMPAVTYDPAQDQVVIAWGEYVHFPGAMSFMAELFRGRTLTLEGEPVGDLFAFCQEHVAALLDYRSAALEEMLAPPSVGRHEPAACEQEPLVQAPLPPMPSYRPGMTLDP